MRNNTPREEHQQILFNAELNANFWALIISIAVIYSKSPKNWEIVLYFITNITNQNDRITMVMVILRARLVLLKPIGFL